MTFTCVCTTTGDSKTVNNCNECTNFCKNQSMTCVPDPDPNPTVNAVLGVSVAIFVTFFIISILLLVFMIWFSVVVMKKCKGKPAWLNPTVITLLILWLLMGWFPGVGLAFFIALLVILIVFNNKCKK